MSKKRNNVNGVKYRHRKRGESTAAQLAASAQLKAAGGLLAKSENASGASSAKKARKRLIAQMAPAHQLIMASRRRRGVSAQ
jgi:hypothetical protein